jgi:archaeosine-15-forming tRNA-guanine transglycosylase
MRQAIPRLTDGLQDPEVRMKIIPTFASFAKHGKRIFFHII